MVGHRQGRYRISALVRKLLVLSTYWRNVPRRLALRRTFAHGGGIDWVAAKNN
jgi:hypothetical protein